MFRLTEPQIGERVVVVHKLAYGQEGTIEWVNDSGYCLVRFENGQALRCGWHAHIVPVGSHLPSARGDEGPYKAQWDLSPMEVKEARLQSILMDHELNLEELVRTQADCLEQEVVQLTRQRRIALDLSGRLLDKSDEVVRISLSHDYLGIDELPVEFDHDMELVLTHKLHEELKRRGFDAEFTQDEIRVLPLVVHTF